MPKIDIYCSHCGSRNITRDATVRWCDATQSWHVAAVFDTADCNDCGGETHLREIDLESGETRDCAIIP